MPRWLDFTGRWRLPSTIFPAGRGIVAVGHGVDNPNSAAKSHSARSADNDVSTAMIYTQVMEKAAARVRSPLDA
ncbi:MAG: hypothetical protein HYR84_15790 [Planctomycetes bacterium]|nr:hypothetical protein [Planctomycetota bacterium]